MKSLFRGLLILVMFACFSAHAKRFRNAYVSFELPPNWNCKLEGSEWVCENDFSGKTKEAIVILTAKEVGPTDTLAAYLAHLQTPRLLPGRGGTPTKSEVIHVSERMIGNQMWIDGMHLGSEVGPYFTRYLATIKDKISILVTFSAHKEHYTKYSGDFIKAVESLRVVASKDTMGGGSIGPDASRSTEVIGSGGAPTPYGGGDFNLPEPGSGGGRSSGKYLNWLILALILGAIGGYFYVKNKKPPPRPRSKPSAPPPPSSSDKRPKK